MYKVTVPSGIGDISWIYSKLCHANKPIWFEVADGWPYRSVPYLKLLPNVAAAKYSDLQYDAIVINQRAIHGANFTWQQLVDQGVGMMYLEANQHLERGKRLEDWLPDLPTDFHYPIAEASIRDHQVVNKLLDWDNVPRPVIAVSAASYRGSEAWQTWGYDEWSPFLRRLCEMTGGSILLMGGFWDDLTHALSEDGYPTIVGKTDVAQAIEVLRRVDHYIGFSSGLGMLRTVLNKSAFMLWPAHQEKLQNSWADPVQLYNGSYMHCLWQSPDKVLPRVIEHFGAVEILKSENSCQTRSELEISPA